MASKKMIQNKVITILTTCQITEPPVDVKKITDCLGIGLEYVKFDDEQISGLLVNKDGKVRIGVNQTQPSNRQRFTVAHEIGHFILHVNKPIFIDEVQQKFRDKESSKGTYSEEIEANAFAAELLMPESFIRADMATLKRWDKESLQQLAEKYEVSLEAFIYRLSNLSFELDLLSL
jgi:Zn-dependent peptidase ImmA (M78 family)